VHVHGLLEDRPREAGIPEPLAARSEVEDRAERHLRSCFQRVFVLLHEAARDLEELLGRVVRKDDLTCEAGPEPRVRVQEALHQPGIAGRDHDQPLAEILHPLQQRLDRLGSEVEPLVLGREGVRLVDEEHSVEGATDDAVGFERSRSHPLPDEAGPVYLDELSTTQKSHRAVHLGE
jgi:hypothetical protein